jgi:pyridinium-3,5-biscarboxylic acid mononucleotide sulfurtransferase
MTDTVHAGLERLRSLVRDCASALVAYSGGVDSALVAAVAAEQLGDQALACIGASPSYPQREQDAAIALAERIGIRLRIVGTNEHLDQHYQANAGDRCYFCKSELFNVLGTIAESEGFAVVLDGSNADDTGDDRPGLRAAAEQGVRSPLREAGLGKEQVREAARLLDLPVWDKPAMACLASRVPQGMPIQPRLLGQIEQAEDVLQSLGFRQFRVRHHGDLARIELLAEDLPRALAERESITSRIRETGYRFVTLDLQGFRSGSLSAAYQEDRTEGQP